MVHWILRRLTHLERFATQVWYLPFLSFLAMADLFIIIIPVEGILVSAVMIQTRRWITIALWMAVGSALGALGLAALIEIHGAFVLEYILRDSLSSPIWIQTRESIQTYGSLALWICSLSPLPIVPAVALAAFGKLGLTSIFFSVLVSRMIKYLFFSWSASHAPRLLEKFAGVRHELEELEHERELEDTDPEKKGSL